MEKQVLVVDDDLVNRKLARAMLEREGWTVSECEDGPAALELAKTDSFTAVLLDISLPGMSGEEVCTRLRQTHDSLFIVAYTAHTSQQDVDRMLVSGFNRVLLKPVTMNAMREVFSAPG
jgi:two-component system chemotaxis response regulator CheY